MVLVFGLDQQVHLFALFFVYVGFHDAAFAHGHQDFQLFELVFEGVQFEHFGFEQFTQLYLWELLVVDEFEERLADVF